MSERRVLILILALFAGLGVTYALATPVFEASDELWHYPMVRHLADGNPLPVQVFDPALAGPWKQEASQPPLYYYLGAALTFWIDASDMQEVRRLNPHVDNGVVTVDRNINLVVHDPQLSPWRGTQLAVRIIRLASVLMGVLTVTFTYHIARDVAAGRPEIALGAAALNAFTPMFLFISGAVNNDNLAIMLTSWAIFLMLKIVKRRQEMSSSQSENGRNAVAPAMHWAALGIVIGLATLTKEGALGLIPLVAGTAAVESWLRAQSQPANGAESLLFWRRLVMRTIALTAITMIPVLLIAGWWYARNIVLYGDWLGWSAFIAVLGERSQPASLAQLWSERWGFLASYWGLFGGVNVPMGLWIYSALNALLVLAIPGFLVVCLRRILRWRAAKAAAQLSAIGRRLQRWLHLLFAFVAAHFALVAAVLFSIAVVYGLINWATTTWSSQGRLAFTAISTLCSLLALGLFGWMPVRAARSAALVVCTFLFGVALVAPYAWILPAYELRDAIPPAPLEPANIVFGDRLALTGYALVEAGGAAAGLSPGDTVDVFLSWRALAPMARDWSVFLHLNDPVLDTPLAQRDMYPGGGLLATSFMQPGDQLVDLLRLRIPATATAPSTLDLVTGLYDFDTNERLFAPEGDAIRLAEIRLEPADRASVATNFGNQFALESFEIGSRRLSADETIALQTEWRALRLPDRDYAFFAQVLGEGDTTRWAAVDIQAATQSWTDDATHVIDMSMKLDAQTPAGVYTLVLGAYTRDEDGAFRRLQIVEDGRITMKDVLQLTRIRVE